jgi:hypothetical protein
MGTWEHGNIGGDLLFGGEIPQNTKRNKKERLLRKFKKLKITIVKK